MSSKIAGPGRINWIEELSLLVVYILMFALLAYLGRPYFLRPQNLVNILLQVSTVGIISVTMTMVIVSGGIDLSIGSVVALTGVIIAGWSHHMPMPAAIAAALLIGTAIGAFNGAAITFAGINPLITTLATLSIVRALAMRFSGGLTQSVTDESFRFLGRGYLLGVPVPVIVMLILFALTAIVMGMTIVGRNIYAIGGNAAASRLAGLPVSALRLTVYTLSGLSAALGGVFLTAQLGAAAPQAASGLELSVIAAVILGGTSLSGGKGTIFGTLLGVLIMGTLESGLNTLGARSETKDFAKGVVLLAAVGIDQLRQHWKRTG